MSQQGLRQASVRSETGTELDYNGDWSALFDAASVAQNSWNGRFLDWINLKLSSSYTDLPGAMQALATSLGVTNFNSIGTFDASTGGGASTAGQPIGLLLALTKAS